MPPSSVHFNGSVNLPDAETVMREIASRIPTGVRRMTDGETGERGYWINFQIQKFLAMPEFESVSVAKAYDTDDPDAPDMPRLRLADGVSPEGVHWPNLGYADAYWESFKVFTALQEDGTIPAGVRFQMQYPTPIASMAGTIAPEDMPGVAAAYEAALFADLDRGLSMIPHDRCAVQWDVAVEFGLLEGGFGPKMPLEQVLPGLVRCVDRVPEDVPVGLHLCYGDYGHQHFKQPESLAMQVQLVNAVVAGAHRPVNWFSFTVPQSRSDEDYFAPLRELRVGPETELYFALVPYHPADQPEGTTAEQVRLIDAVLAQSPSGTREWGICTECGMGRAAAEDVPGLLDLHREILQANISRSEQQSKTPRTGALRTRPPLCQTALSGSCAAAYRRRSDSSCPTGRRSLATRRPRTARSEWRRLDAEICELRAGARVPLVSYRSLVGEIGDEEVRLARAPAALSSLLRYSGGRPCVRNVQDPPRG